MSAQFIYTPKGYVNVSQIAIARSNRDGTHRLYDLAGELLDERCVDFGSQIVSIAPCSEPTEYLTIMPADEEHAEEILVEPVVAWGLTMLGDTVPITPSSMDGVEELHYGLRKVGQERVYTSSNIGGWENAKAWLEYMKSVGKPVIIGEGA